MHVPVLHEFNPDCPWKRATSEATMISPRDPFFLSKLIGNTCCLSLSISSDKFIVFHQSDRLDIGDVQKRWLSSSSSSSVLRETPWCLPSRKKNALFEQNGIAYSETNLLLRGSFSNNPCDQLHTRRHKIA